MLKKNSKHKNISGIVVCFLSPLLPSCASNEKKLTGLGFFILILFLLCWGASIFLPKIQENEKVKVAIFNSKKPVKLVANILMFIFAILALLFIFISDGINILLGAVFGIGIVGLYYLKKWANSTESKNKLELKMLVLSISFIIALVWLVFYGSSILRL